MEQRRAEEEATGKKKRGRKPKVVEPLPTEEAKANTTDPDSRIMKTRQGYVQGYNAQAVVSEEQIIVAVGVTQEANDVQQLEPMLQTMAHTLEAAGIEDRPKAGLADAGYWSEARVQELTVQEFVPKLAVEALNIPILPRATRCDEEGCGSHPLEPQPHSPGGELGPLSERRCSGTPRWTMRSPRHSMTWGERNERPTWMARHSLVYSSTTVRRRTGLPSLVRRATKSYAQTWFRRCGPQPHAGAVSKPESARLAVWLVP